MPALGQVSERSSAKQMVLLRVGQSGGVWRGRSRSEETVGGMTWILFAVVDYSIEPRSELTLG